MAVRNSYLCMLIAVAATAETTALGVRPFDVTAFKGERAMFNCSGSSVIWYRYEWYRVDSSSADLYLVLVKIFESPDTWYKRNHQNKFAVTGRYNLIVYDVDARSDGGTYVCNTDEDNTLLKANLVVIESVSLDVHPAGFLSRGITITISCTVHYGAPVSPTRLSRQQEPMITLSLDNEQQFTGEIEVQNPPAGSILHRKSLAGNYTVTKETRAGGYLRCTVNSLSFQNETRKMLQLKFPPRIVRNFDEVYNKTDIITCSAEGFPRPTVTWSHVSGSISINAPEESGEGQAVLSNLREGDHKWQCSAKNDLGLDNVTVAFTVGDASEDGHYHRDAGEKAEASPGLGFLVFVTLTLRLLC